MRTNQAMIPRTLRKPYPSLGASSFSNTYQPYNPGAKSAYKGPASVQTPQYIAAARAAAAPAPAVTAPVSSPIVSAPVSIAPVAQTPGPQVRFNPGSSSGSSGGGGGWSLSTYGDNANYAPGVDYTNYKNKSATPHKVNWLLIAAAVFGAALVIKKI